MAHYKRLNEKKLKDDAETALAFQEFIETFQTEGPAPKSFVKSGVYNPGRAEETEDDKGTLYNVSALMKFQVSHDTTKKALECAKLLKENKYNRPKHNITKPKSNLDEFKEELRLRQINRESRDAKQKQKPDATISADPSSISTNLFLTKLNAKLNEEDLTQIFGQYGALASVKIMWPRPDDRTRTGNVGFVAYMSRKDSERAYTGLADREDMMISWGKPIEIPVHPIYIPPELAKEMLPPPYSGLPFNAQPLAKNYAVPKTVEEMDRLLNNSVVKVAIPTDKDTLINIHRVIEFIIREGPTFESLIMTREIANPAYQFLYNNKSPEHVYYRWKLFSMLNGDKQTSWSIKPFRMFKGGSIWIPPVLMDYTKGMKDNTPVKSDPESLSDNQQFRLIQIIQNLTLSKSNIANAMVFCLKHAESAKDVVSIIYESFQNPLTLAAKKIARLYLISDIIANTKLTTAPLSNFPELFKPRLQAIFEYLSICHDTLTQVEDKKAFRSRALRVITAWEMWTVYNSTFLNKLKTTLLRENCDDQSDTETITHPLGYNSDRLVHHGNKQKVEPEEQKDEDIYANFIQSKWETLDPAEIESQAMTSQTLHDIESKRKENETGLNYDKLRDVELKVLQYQDELESGERRLRNNNTIEEEVNEYRKICIEKLKREAIHDKSSYGEDRDVRRYRRSHKRKAHHYNKRYRR